MPHKPTIRRHSAFFNNQLAESLLAASQGLNEDNSDMVDYVSQHLFIQSSMMLQNTNLSDTQRQSVMAFRNSCQKLINAENDTMKQQAIAEIKQHIA